MSMSDDNARSGLVELSESDEVASSIKWENGEGDELGLDVIPQGAWMATVTAIPPDNISDFGNDIPDWKLVETGVLFTRTELAELIDRLRVVADELDERGWGVEAGA
jgi:hypothetical protein